MDIVWGVQRNPPDVHLLFEYIPVGGMNRVCGHYTLLVPAANKLSASMHVPKCVPHFAASCSVPLLKVRLEFLELLLAGDKVWELRSSPVQRRGRVALGIGGVAYGSAVLCDSIFVGVKKPGSAWVPPDDNSDNFWLSAENMSSFGGRVNISDEEKGQGRARSAEALGLGFQRCNEVQEAAAIHARWISQMDHAAGRIQDVCAIYASLLVAPWLR